MEKSKQFLEDVAKLQSWAKSFREFKANEWDTLPDIDLYMDQVIGYLNRQLKNQGKDDREEGQILTPSMINNYVKSGLVTHPDRKKYVREHLAQLYMLCSMKQSLNIPDASELIRRLSEERNGTKEVYNSFVSDQHAINEGIALVIEQADAVNSEYDLMRIAVGLVLNATAERIAAERIIALLRSNEEPAAPVPDVPAEPVEKKKPEPKKKPSDKKK
ncbi:MAG: DUF1836 domain-containing protein [Clostridia bacterium]|nr:DUF1836 domain-containing protein [Clostridia bacterium]